MQKILNSVIILLAILLLLLLGYYMYSSQESSTEQKKETQIKIKNSEKLEFPTMDTEFDFETINGVNFKLRASKKKIKVDGLENKIVFLKIFGWDCKYCQKEIPELIKLKKDLGDTFDVIAIEAEQHTNEESKKHIQMSGINYNIVNGVKHNSFYNYLKVYYGWSGIIPVTIVLGKNGDILAYEVGAQSYTLTELLNASIERDKK